ncbi:MAG TPA: DUF1697 domain-containing protein, partial [Acidimicrobiia bacterium]|nr:DUF1697 domain-containing protein [Acidimicrobiia bacterium]
VLLRGINVGGAGKLPMAALRETCARLGCEDIVTYIQSGNVVLRSRLPAARLRTALAAAIETGFGFAPEVMVRTAQELAAVVAANPYPGADTGGVHVGFLHEPPGAAARRCLTGLDGAAERITAAGRELYYLLPNGMGRADLPVKVERCIRPAPVTVRNWNTVTKLAELSSPGRG